MDLTHQQKPIYLLSIHIDHSSFGLVLNFLESMASSFIWQCDYPVGVCVVLGCTRPMSPLRVCPFVDPNSPHLIHLDLGFQAQLWWKDKYSATIIFTIYTIM